jgi:hypothetical protein
MHCTALQCTALCRPVFLFVAAGEVVGFAHGADSGTVRNKIK